MTGQPIVYETLARMGIAYESIEHIPVFTIEEMEQLPIPADVMVAKNLFLRDAKGKRHFLVVMRKDRPADLRSLEQTLGTSRLSFASEERLSRHLGLTKGSVSPFGLLNNADASVEAVFDKGLAESPRIGVHPNDNAATLFLTYDDLLRIMKERGTPTHFI